MQSSTGTAKFGIGDDSDVETNEACTQRSDGTIQRERSSSLSTAGSEMTSSLLEAPTRVRKFMRRVNSLPVSMSGYVMNNLRKRLQNIYSSRGGGLNQIHDVKEEKWPTILEYPFE